MVARNDGSCLLATEAPADSGATCSASKIGAGRLSNNYRGPTPDFPVGRSGGPPRGAEMAGVVWVLTVGGPNGCRSRGVAGTATGSLYNRAAMTERRLLAVILLLFLALGLTYALTTPPFEASDELWHYPLVRHLADGNPLPVQVFDPDEAGPWRQQASQPPLDYYVAAALTFWIDTGDMEAVRWLNPHVDNGVVTADGNVNLAVHDPALNPWRGTLLALRLIRLFSLMLGLASLYLTYRLGQEIAPGRPAVYLGATALMAFTPMYLFISGAVNSDNLIIPLAALACWLMIRLVRRSAPGRPPPAGVYVGLGVVIGLAALAKIPGVGLLALALGAAAIASWIALGRPDSWSGLAQAIRRTLGAFLLVLTPALAIAGWWYGRNLWLYGDWRGWNAFIAVLGQRARPATLAQLWDERWGFMQSYWGLFGGVNVSMPDWIYHLLNGLIIVSVPGFALYLWRARRHEPAPFAPQAAGRPAALGEASPGSSVGDRRLNWGESLPGSRTLASLLALVETFFPLVVAVLWSLAVVVGLVQWATVTWSSQGRLVFYALPMLSLLTMLGLVGWLPRPADRVVASLVGASMFVVAASAPWLWIQPAYRPALGCPEPIPQPLTVDFGDRMRLRGYQLEAGLLQPGTSLDLVLYWEALASMEQDWSVFVHLNDPVLDTPVAQRDMFPGQGLLATRLLKPGQCLANRYHLTVPVTAVAPAELALTVGLYDFVSGARLPITRIGPGATTARAQSDGVILASLALEPAGNGLPNATSVNFGDELELLGFELTPRRVPPGGSFELTLYWRPFRPLSRDYTIFAQLLEDFGGANQRWAAYDLSPAEGTSTWPVTEVRSVTLPLTVDAAAPARALPLVIGVYTRSADGGFANLPLVTADGRVTQNSVWSLTPVRVGE